MQNFLNKRRITYKVDFRGGATLDNWSCFEWEVSFSRPYRPSFKLPFHMGTGLLKNGKPRPPDAKEVLCSVMQDAAALDTSFAHWCADLGFNEDSIKDFDVYRRCSELGKTLQQFFDSAERKELEVLLENY